LRDDEDLGGSPDEPADEPSATNASAADLPVAETDVEIKTPDGTCNAAFIHPRTGAYPGVIIWADAFGLRPVLREMGRTLAKEGYAVLVPNPFYRVTRDPTLEFKNFNFGNPDDRAKLAPLMGSITAEGAAEKDALAFIAWLDQQKEVDKTKKIGTQGYCMGGPIAFRTSAAMPDRVGAVASFHGDGLLTNQPNSPHTQASKTKAQFLIAIATNDDERSPNEKNVLKETFEKAKLSAEIEVYGGAHGWCPPDSRVYKEDQAEKAWSRLLALYGKALS